MASQRAQRKPASLCVSGAPLVLEAADELGFAEDVVFNGLLELGFGGVGLEIDYVIQRV